MSEDDNLQSINDKLDEFDQVFSDSHTSLHGANPCLAKKGSSSVVTKTSTRTKTTHAGRSPAAKKAGRKKKTTLQGAAPKSEHRHHHHHRHHSPNSITHPVAMAGHETEHISDGAQHMLDTLMGTRGSACERPIDPSRLVVDEELAIRKIGDWCSRVEPRRSQAGHVTVGSIHIGLLWDVNASTDFYIVTELPDLDKLATRVGWSSDKDQVSMTKELALVNQIKQQMEQVTQEISRRAVDFLPQTSSRVVIRHVLVTKMQVSSWDTNDEEDVMDLVENMNSHEFQSGDDNPVLHNQLETSSVLGASEQPKDFVDAFRRFINSDIKMILPIPDQTAFNELVGRYNEAIKGILIFYRNATADSWIVAKIEHDQYVATCRSVASLLQVAARPIASSARAGEDSISKQRRQILKDNQEIVENNKLRFTLDLRKKVLDTLLNVGKAKVSANPAYSATHEDLVQARKTIAQLEESLKKAIREKSRLTDKQTVDARNAFAIFAVEYKISDDADTIKELRGKVMDALPT